MATDTREDRQARAVRTLGEAAQQRTQAKRALDAATNHVRDAVLEARAAGVSVRRAAEVGDVSPSTVDVWVQNHRERVLAEVRRRLDQAVTPPRRGWHLADRHPRTRVRRGQRSVPLFSENSSDVAPVLAAAYAHVLDTDPFLSPGSAAAAERIRDVVERLGDLPAASPVGEVLAAVDYRPFDKLAAALDRAARLLLEEPHESWQAALLLHLPARPHRATFAGVTSARQILDTVLAGPSGGHAPGTLVRLVDGGQALVTEARWRRGSIAPTGYMVTPVEVGRVEMTVSAEEVTAAAEDGR